MGGGDRRTEMEIGQRGRDSEGEKERVSEGTASSKIDG